MHLYRKFDFNNVKSNVNNHYNHPNTNPLVIRIVFILAQFFSSFFVFNFKKFVFKTIFFQFLGRKVSF